MTGDLQLDQAAWFLDIIILWCKFEGQLHSKIIMPGLIGFFHRVRWWKSKVKTRTGTRSNRRLKMAEISRVTTTRPGLRHWRQASGIRGCGMVLSLTGRNRFTTAGRIRTDSGWSWTFWIARVDHAWLLGGTTDATNARTRHFFAVWPSSRSIFYPGPSPLDSTKKSIRSELMAAFFFFLNGSCSSGKTDRGGRQTPRMSVFFDFSAIARPEQQLARLSNPYQYIFLCLIYPTLLPPLALATYKICLLRGGLQLPNFSENPNNVRKWVGGVNACSDWKCPTLDNFG